MSKFQLNPAFNPEEFLREHWQQKPVLLPGLISNFEDPITPQELAGLACEESVESRLVSEPESDHWQLRHSPFLESDFTGLPDSHWTLLVQAVDQWVEGVSALKSAFDFIPSWRIDDVMVSYATAQGGVGPHFDYYDVFLLQGSGQRRWQVGQHCVSDVALQDNSELGILQSFTRQEEFLLNPGDALYIPPQTAHWGIAESNSLCYSIGFRAPSMAEMVEGFSDFLIAAQDPGNRYRDSKLQIPSRPAEIEAELLEDSFQELMAGFANKSKFRHWFGCYVTQAKYPELVLAPESQLDAGEFKRLLGTGLTLKHNPCSRFAFMQKDSSVLLFVDGSMTEFTQEHIKVISQLCEATALNNELIKELVTSPNGRELLIRLINQGSLLAD